MALALYHGLLIDFNQGPPEPNLYSVNPTVDSLQKFDLWSIGCVFSEAATWVVLGKTGIEKFQTIRRRTLDRLYIESRNGESKGQTNIGTKIVRRGDYFHDGTDVLAVVTSWHNFLRSTLRKSDTVTSKILNIVDQRLLVNAIKERIDAKALSVQLSHVFEESEAESDLLPPIDPELKGYLEEEEAGDYKDVVGTVRTPHVQSI